MPELAAILRCPGCGAESLELRANAYECACGRHFPIDGGIARFVDSLEPDHAQVQRVFDFEHRRYRDSWFTRFDSGLVDQFLEDCRLPREFFDGKRVLDAGCGSGRWTYALSELGADVVAIDLTAGGIESAHEALGDRANVTFCQADLFSLPFRAESFDFVMSWGVLHHTRNTRAAFSNLVPLVRRRGTLYVMVYERLAPVRLFFTNALRAVMRRLPDERRYRACRLLVIKNPLIARGVGAFVMASRYDSANPHLDRRTLQFGLFDAYSPRYNHVHSRTEVEGWFTDAGFEEIKVVESPPGAVKVRGKRVAQSDP
jgi:2-polyprenyl-3-methyl-5-hydroxy-6-metoxy-1,4-benzoquinol methylase